MPNISSAFSGMTTNLRTLIGVDLRLLMRVGLCGMIMGWANAVWASEQSHYEAVIDAGSSGSRLYLYRVIDSQESYPIVQDVMSYEPRDLPGLSSFKGEPERAVTEGVQPLLNALDAFLLRHHMASAAVQVSLIATGGMRSMGSAESALILEAVKKAMQNRPYHVGRVEVISGQMEAFYAWIDINVLAKRMNQTHLPSLGIVEIGGSSAQIAFEVSRDGPGVVDFPGGKVRRRVYSESFQGLGQNASRKRMIQFGSEREGWIDACFPKGLDREPLATDLPKEVTGQFNLSVCRGLYRRVLNEFSLQTLKTSEGRSTSFLAIGNGSPIGAIDGALKVWNLSERRLSGLADRASGACSMSWKRVKRHFGGAFSSPSQCANAVFIHTFLFDDDGLGLRYDQVRAQKRIQGREPTWTRGFLMAERGL